VADGPWRDPARVRRAFDAALADVERLCGAEFGAERPTVAIATRAEIVDAIRGEAERGLLGEIPAERAGAYLETLAEAMYGKYDEAGDRVLVSPSNAEAFAHVAGWPELIGEHALRSVLTHELTHALDVRRFPWTELRIRTRDPEARRALVAVIEGHAEMVSMRAVRERGADALAAHEFVTRSMTEAPGETGPQDAAALRPLAAAFAFPYRQGREFCEHVFTAGGATALERALREPPARVRQIEAPRRWLEQTPDPRPALDAALAPLLRLAPTDATPSHESMLATSLRAAYAEVDAGRLETALRRFEAGRTLGAVADRGARIFSAAILSFEDAASAAEFIALLRDSAAKSQGAAPQRPGASVALDDVDEKSGALPGFVLRQSSADGARDARVRIARSGRHVLEVTLVGMNHVAAVQLEAALDEAAALANRPASTPPK
jgi:hypothetical protein